MRQGQKSGWQQHYELLQVDRICQCIMMIG